MSRFREALAPGGCLVVHHPTRSNLLRHERPSAPFLLEDRELKGLVAGLELVQYDSSGSFLRPRAEHGARETGGSP